MKSIQFVSISLLILLSGGLLQTCELAKNEKKKIVYINSFHRGHPSSDGIMDGFIQNMPKDSFEIDVYYMDTKRNPSRAHIEQIAAQLYDTIQLKKPDILLVSDDNAVKYILKPNLKKISMPVIFCGVNWTDREYNLPLKKVTGILEMLPVADMVNSMKAYYPSMEKLLFLSENTTTSRKEKQLLDTLFDRVGVSVSHELVDDFERWKEVFKKANQQYDIIYLPTHAAIKGWDHDEAVHFIHQQIQVPVVTTEDFMMPYAVFGVTKVAEEHGIWAAATAKKILRGQSTADFPVTRNKLSTIWINPKLAEKIGFVPDSVLLNNASIVKD